MKGLPSLLCVDVCCFFHYKPHEVKVCTTAEIGILFFPPFQPWNTSREKPRQQAVHSIFFHLLHTIFLELLCRIDFWRGEKLSIHIAHGAVFVASGSISISSAFFRTCFHWIPATLTKKLLVHYSTVAQS